MPNNPFFSYRPPSISLPQFSYQPRHFSLPSLPSMTKVSETLGALNSLGRYFLQKTNSANSAERFAIPTTERPVNESEEDSDEDDIPAAASTHYEKISNPPLVVDPAQDKELGTALYTLGRNVLGKVRRVF